jgi:glycosyltransferase involved in cell wall biosynthesis
MIEMITKLTLGLCVKNGAKVVETAFDSISIQDYPHELMKLIIVADGSDNTLSLALEFAKQTDIQTSDFSSKGTGLGTSRQMVVDNAEGDYLVWVDDDIVLTKDFVRNQVEFMERNPAVGAAKCNYIRFLTKPLINIVNFAFLLPSKKLNYIATAGAIFRLEALRSVGGFDVRIKGAGEDLDVSRRIKRSGWALAINDSVGFYQKHPPATLKDFWKKFFNFGYGSHFLFHIHNDRTIVSNFLPPLVLLSGLIISCRLYRVTHMKKVFFILILSSFIAIAQSLGFVRAHLDGYGHLK